MRHYEDPHRMRIRDIACERVHVGDPYTPEVYIPCGQGAPPVTRQPAHIVRRGMCYKSGGDVDVCRECPAQCVYGKRMIELEGEKHDEAEKAD